MARRDDYDEHDDAGWFRDQLRQRDREIAELRRESKDREPHPISGIRRALGFVI